MTTATVTVRSPYPTSHEYDAIDPETGTRRTVHFEHGAAILTADDPLVPLFRGLTRLARPLASSWTVTTDPETTP